MLALLAQDEAVLFESVDRIVLAPYMVTIITGLLLPFLLALITKLDADSKIKAVLGVGMAGVGALVARAITLDGSAVFTWPLLLDVGMVYIPQALSYVALYSKFDINAKMAPQFGIG